MHKLSISRRDLESYVQWEARFAATQRADWGGPLTKERILQAGKVSAWECRLIDDLRGSAAYRRRLVRNLFVCGPWPYVTS